jgi:hypothetical protein
LTSVSALLISIATSCHEKGGKFIDQGEIHYTIEYIRSSGTMSQELKPRNLVIAFKKDKILFEIMAPIGNQGIINVTNPESHIFDTYINMLGVRYYYAGSVGEVYPGFASMDGMEIIKTDRTEVICGYDCKNAVVTFPNNTKKYNIWYTDQIKVNNSNSNSPYSSIGGVLMSFYYILGGTEMKFEAETVYKKDIPDKAFERRGRFRPVSKKDMDKIITDMVNL